MFWTTPMICWFCTAASLGPCIGTFWFYWYGANSRLGSRPASFARWIRSNSALVTRRRIPSSSSSSSSSSASFFALASARRYSCSSNLSSSCCLRCFLDIRSSLNPPPLRSSLAERSGRLSKKPFLLGMLGSTFCTCSLYWA